MKKLITLLLILFFNTLFAQRKYSKEFSFINDNDLFTSTQHDRYYSNGVFFSYRFLSDKSNQKLEKKIYEIQFGHHIYTPFKATVQSYREHDRPFAAYLYGDFGINKFYQNQSILKTSLQIGVIGSNAFGEELQDFIHDMYNFKKAIGWKFQIANAFALNLSSSYIKHLVKDASNHYDLSWTNNANVGTVFSNISTGLYGRIGFKPLEKLVNSIAFNGNLNNDLTNFNNEAEAFIYIKPMITYRVYDATIQGSFLNTGSPITYTLIPLVYTAEIGIRFTYNRFNFGYSINYHSKKLESIQVPDNNHYGTILINYQFN